MNGTPVSNEGDLISREALKDFAYINKGNFNTVEGIREWIDNAPTVEYPFYREAYQTGYEEGQNERPQVNCKNCDGYEAGYSAGLKDAERPQGKWITRHKQNSFGKDIVCFECDKCGKYTLPIIHTMITESLGVCPNCGANMRKGESE